MKKKNIDDLRSKKTEELKKSVMGKKKELALFMSEIVLQKEKNVKKGKLLRMEIARMLTLVRERDIAGKEII